MKQFAIQTQQRTEIIDITRQVQSMAQEMNLEDGMLAVFVPHTTAGITINENADPDVKVDLMKVLDQLVPWKGHYRHSEGNAAAHVKAGLMGTSVIVPVASGRLKLGTWQGILFCEFDGPRQRMVWVTGSNPVKS